MPYFETGYIKRTLTNTLNTFFIFLYFGHIMARFIFVNPVGGHKSVDEFSISKFL